MSGLIASISQALALASSFHGTWDCEPVGPVFTSATTLQTEEMTSDLIAHTEFNVEFRSVTMEASGLSVDLLYRGKKSEAAQVVYIAEQKFAFVVPLKSGPDLKAFLFIATPEGKSLRIEATYPVVNGVRKFGAFAPQKILGDIAVASAMYDCNREAAQ